MRPNNVTEFMKEHKKQIIIGAGITAVVVGGVIVYRHVAAAGRPSIGNAQKGVDVMKQGASSGSPINFENIVQKTVDIETMRPNGSTSRLTATRLGDKVWKSAKEINRRLIDAGLLERTPNGTLYATEAGKKFCNLTAKTRPWDYTAYVYEWDEEILKHIFSVEELAEIAKKQKVAEILGRIA